MYFLQRDYGGGTGIKRPHTIFNKRSNIELFEGSDFT